MKVKRKDGPPLGPWDIAACVMAGLLYLDVLCFLILTVAGIGLLLVYALECGIVTGVLLLLGCSCIFWGNPGAWGSCPGGCFWAGSSPGACCCCSLPWPWGRLSSTPLPTRQGCKLRKGETVVEFSNNQRAQVLVQALPYIKKYAGKTVVVKYGGNAMIDEGLKNDVMNDIVLMQLVGINVVLVHGGGPEINAMLKKIQKESKFLNGMRVTDQETMDIVQQVLAGKVNKDLVQRLEDAGGKAVGLCGLDGSLLKADQLDTQLGFVGEIREVNAEILQNASANGYVPIVSTVAAGYHGEVFNINADVAAARIAASLGAMKLILMTDVRGLLRTRRTKAPSSPW